MIQEWAWQVIENWWHSKHERHVDKECCEPWSSKECQLCKSSELFHHSYFTGKFDLDLTSNALAIEGYLRGDKELYPCN